VETSGDCETHYIYKNGTGRNNQNGSNENSREPKPRPTNINITKFIESSKYYKKKAGVHHSPTLTNIKVILLFN
jgi:hypothetical protein